MFKHEGVSTVAGVGDENNTGKEVRGGSGEGKIDVLKIPKVERLALESRGL